MTDINSVTDAVRVGLIEKLATVIVVASGVFILLPRVWHDPGDVPESILVTLVFIIATIQAVGAAYAARKYPKWAAKQYSAIVYCLLYPLSIWIAASFSNEPSSEWLFGYASLIIVTVGALVVPSWGWLAAVVTVWASWIIPAALLNSNPGVNVQWRTGVVMCSFATAISFFISRSYRKYVIATIKVTKSAVNQAHHDGLTGLLNRRGVVSESVPKMETAADHGLTVQAIFVDLNNLKTVNDRYGHDAGDEAIKLVAEGLRATTRTGVDQVARWGGDEFIILSSGSTVNTIEFEQRLNSWLKEHTPKSVSWVAWVTVGTASSKTNRVVSIEHLLEEADQEMYQRKPNHK